MTGKLREIRKKITSDDKSILEHSLALVQKCIKEDKEREKAVEMRAIATFTGLVIFAGFGIPFIKPTEGFEKPLTLSLMYAGFLLFLLKAIYYTFKVLRNTQRFAIKPSTVYEFQSATLNDFLRDNITEKIWIYGQEKNVINKKMSYMNRLQLNGIIAVAFYVCFVLISIFWRKFEIMVPLYIIHILIISIAGIWFLVDLVLEDSSAI